MMVDDRWVQRMEEDVRSIRNDMKDGLQQISGQVRQLGDQFQLFQLSLPPAYVNRQDLTDKLKSVTDKCDERDEIQRETVKRIESSIQKLIFVVVSALITASLGLLNEVFHLLGPHTP